MNVVDSSAWIEFFVDGPNARVFERPIRDTEALLVPSVVVLEVYRHVLRQRGREQALVAAATMRQGQPIELDEALAIEAAELGATHGLPLADSIIYASAALHSATLWTQDADFEGLDGVQYHPKSGAL
ncbi:MAG: type II toxin-antitoxin system VapC family toxin [Gemmatimonadetes bacterium]|nr:type II toxin-antitoxin system VapC family toxin [Gemmatimonadota bacterium]